MTESRLCPVCDGNAPRLLFVPRRSPGPVSECSHCGMVYVSELGERKSIIFDGPVVGNIQDPAILTSSSVQDVEGCWEYGMLAEKEAEWPALRANAEDVLARMESLLPQHRKPLTILNFASGWGFFLAAARDRGWETLGLEPLAVSATYARAKLGLKITTDTLRDDSFPPDHFAAIASFQVFEHLPTPRDDLHCLTTMLQPGGVILVEVPLYGTWIGSLLRSRHRHFTQDHINFFSARTLKRLFGSCGLQVVAAYRPVRRISTRYLVSYWGSRLLPGPGSRVLGDLAKAFHVWEAILAIRTGDVIAVIGRKPDASSS